jgi:uncharacterized protein (TIGR00730 family)
MPDQPPIRPFPHAGEDISTTREKTPTPQTLSPSYRLAFADDDFLLTDELRGTRLMLEYLKPELALRAHRVKSTVVVFGSTRITDPDAAPTSARRPNLERDYYREARRFAALLSARNRAEEGHECVIMTGGGPGIMEAANRGAAEVGAKSIGLNIVLPREQVPNSWITPELTFQFHYFALRKLHFLLRAKALVAFPGGFGTLDELFEALTLLQTRRIQPMPILLFGEAFWRRIIDFDAMVEVGVIAREDLELFRFVETAEQAVEWIREGGCEPCAEPL